MNTNRLSTSHIEGEVYVIDYGNGSSFKIGMTTTDVQTRFKQISTQKVIMPMHLVMSGFVNNCKQVENLLHIKFSEMNIQGEWFELQFPDLVEIYQILSLLGSPELYDRWFDLVPKDLDKLIEHNVLYDNFPSFKRSVRNMDIPDYFKL